MEVKERISAHFEEQCIIVMRHGERRDGEPDSTPEHDPPLTPAGIEDVARIADKLREVFCCVEDIQLMSSPFLRSRETAYALFENGIGSSSPVLIDNSLSEVFGPIRIKAKPPHAFVDPEVVEEGIGNMPAWGETLEAAHRRYCNAFKSILLAAEKKCRETGVRMVPLLVTHGDALGAIIQHLYPSRMVYRCEYLSFFISARSAVDSSTSIIYTEDIEWIDCA